LHKISHLSRFINFVAPDAILMVFRAFVFSIIATLNLWEFQLFYFFKFRVETI